MFRAKQKSPEQKSTAISKIFNKNLSSFDLFKRDLPQFNIRGSKKVSSACGSSMSLLVISILLLYITVKFSKYISRTNPSISTFEDVGYFDSSKKFNLHDAGVRLAFGFEGSIDKQDKVDPRYTRLLTRVHGKKDGERVETLVPYHKCTDEELAAFPPTRPDSMPILEAIRSDPKRNLYCLDQDKFRDLFEIWGTIYGKDYQHIEIVLVPCNYRHVEIEDRGDVVSAKCNRDKEAQMAFLGNINVVLYVSEQRFRANKYDAHPIENYSNVMTRQIDQTKPKWLEFKLKENELQDD